MLYPVEPWARAHLYYTIRVALGLQKTACLAKDRGVKERVHQSWFFVAFCGGIIVGTILAIVFGWSFLTSIWWAVGAGLVFLGVCYYNIYLFLVVAVMTGGVVAGWRVAQEAGGQKALEKTSLSTWQDRKLKEEARTKNPVTKMRDWFARRINKLIKKPEASLGMAYLLGVRDGLPKELKENLRTAGLVHIVVASGAHLSILVNVARRIFGRISRFAGLLFSILLVLFFMVMVGWTPSILRAGVMSILTISMWYVGRKFAPWRLILIVMAITLMVEPMFVVNLGWQLSFASFGGIMILGPEMTSYFYGDRKPSFLGAVVITTIAATLMTLPILLYFCGTISLIVVIANLLILPTLPYTMGLVFLAGSVLGWPVLEEMVGLLATKMLSFHIFVINLLGTQKMFLVKIPPGQVAVFGLYLVILAPFGVRQFREKMLKLNKITGRKHVRTQQVGDHKTPEGSRRCKTGGFVYENRKSNRDCGKERDGSEHEPSAGDDAGKSTVGEYAKGEY